MPTCLVVRDDRFSLNTMLLVLVIAPKCAMSLTQMNNGFKRPFSHLVKEYGSRMNLEILILPFDNKNCFDMNLKQFAFEILQLLGYYLSQKRDYLLLCLAMRSLMKIHHEMTFCFKVKGLSKSSRFCTRKNLSFFFFEHLFLST